MSKSTQRERLRKQLYDIQNDIAPALAAVVRTNRSDVWMDLKDAEFDVASLRQLGERIREREFMLDSKLAEEVRRMLLTTGDQEFLAGFEELENKVTQARGTAAEVVMQARETIAALRADLASALAEYHDAAGHPDAAIPVLRSAQNALPHRQDLARRLVVAYLKTGQAALASDVRRNFDLKQE
jgi:predicted house-cleaning noncanonical NTP pyrophosphatase (MazG superfamily)